MASHPLTRTIDLAEASAEEFRAVLVRVAEELERRILLLAGTLDRDPNDPDRIAPTRVNIARLEAQRRQIDELLVQSGFPRAVSAFAQRYGPLRQEVQSAWREVGIPASFSEVDLAALRVVLGAQLDRFAAISTTATEVIREHLVHSITLGDAFETFRIRLDEALHGEKPGLLKFAGTWASTATAQMNRTMNARLGESAGITRFQYVGGIIASTREFCRELDGKILTREEIDRLDNGQTAAGSVFVSAGGFNCRHVWSPVLEESEASMQVAQKYAAQVDEARADLAAEARRANAAAELPALRDAVDVAADEMNEAMSALESIVSRTPSSVLADLKGDLEQLRADVASINRRRARRR